MTSDVIPKGFDFSIFDAATACDTPHEFELTAPFDFPQRGISAGDPIGVFLSVIGAESDAFQQYLRAEANALRKKAFADQRKGKGDGPVMVEEEEEVGLRALAMCVKGWRTVIDGKSEPVITDEGKRLECTPENVIHWLRKYRPFRVQINDATADLANFVGNSSPASAPMPKPSSN